MDSRRQTILAFLKTRGHVPVDVPHIVVILILAQIGEIEPKAAKQCAVIAVQQTVQAADDRPLQPAQDQLRIARRT